MKLFLNSLIFSFSFNALAQIPTIPVVVHVLYNNATPSPNGNIPDQQIFDQIASLNADYRRQNADTIYTQTVYRPIAADCEIEFALATVDPWGNSTTGITRTYTDSAEFYSEFSTMKFDSTGGKSAWDPCRYLNIWICKINSFMPGVQILGYATKPGTDYAIDGIVIRPNYFGHDQNINGRLLTYETGNYFGLRNIDSNDCTDTDSISDTPIQDYTYIPWAGCFTNPDTFIASCSNNPDGTMLNNYMSYTDNNCANMFTQGQKTRIHETLNTTRRGLIEPSTCGTGVQEDFQNLHALISPNPFSTQTILQTNTPLNNATLTLYNVNGQRVKQLNTISGNTIALQRDNLPSGLYFLQLMQDNQLFTSVKIIITDN